jgi:hypothetical protein
LGPVLERLAQRGLSEVRRQPQDFAVRFQDQTAGTVPWGPSAPFRHIPKATHNPERKLSGPLRFTQTLNPENLKSLFLRLFVCATPRLLRGSSVATPPAGAPVFRGYSAATPRPLRGDSAATPWLLRRLVRRYSAANRDFRLVEPPPRKTTLNTKTPRPLIIGFPSWGNFWWRAREGLIK